MKGESAHVRFNSKWTPEPFSGCWLWTARVDYIGYGQFRLGGMMPAHRASWILFKSLIPEGLDVLHRCDTRGCVNPEHLFLGTHQDNMRDRDVKGRQASGERNGKTKLTREQVLEIRSSSEPASRLAPKYGVGLSTVGHIKRGTRWIYE